MLLMYLLSREVVNRIQRKINLSIPQGRFLFFLPFPNADPQQINEIMRKAEVDPANTSEILDIVDALIGFGVIEKSV